MDTIGDWIARWRRREGYTSIPQSECEPGYAFDFDPQESSQQLPPPKITAETSKRPAYKRLILLAIMGSLLIWIALRALWGSKSELLNEAAPLKGHFVPCSTHCTNSCATAPANASKKSKKSKSNEETEAPRLCCDWVYGLQGQKSCPISFTEKGECMCRVPSTSHYSSVHHTTPPSPTQPTPLPTPASLRSSSLQPPSVPPNLAPAPSLLQPFASLAPSIEDVLPSAKEIVDPLLPSDSAMHKPDDPPVSVDPTPPDTSQQQQQQGGGQSADESTPPGTDPSPELSPLKETPSSDPPLSPPPVSLPLEALAERSEAASAAEAGIAELEAARRQWEAAKEGRLPGVDTSLQGVKNGAGELLSAELPPPYLSM